MNMSNNTGSNEVQPVIYTYNLTCPGIPLTGILNSIALLLNAYGVRHAIPYDPNFEGAELTTGDARTDVRFRDDYFGLKNILDSMSREFRDVHCGAHASAIGAHLTFTCRP